MSNTIISENYFKNEIKPKIDLLSISNFIDTNIVHNIDKNEFKKEYFILKNNTIDNQLQIISDFIESILMGKVEEFLVGEFNNKELMETMSPELDYNNKLENNFSLYEGKMFAFLETFKKFEANYNDGLHPQVLLCSRLAYTHFCANRFIKRLSNTIYELQNLKFVYCSKLDEIEKDNNDLLSKKVKRGFHPALFVAFTYDNKKSNPIKLEVMLPQKVDDKIEFYYKLNMVETEGLDADIPEEYGGLPSLNPISRIVPTLKLVKRVRIGIIPYLIEV